MQLKAMMMAAAMLLAAAPQAHAEQAPVHRGAAGTWTKISTGNGGITYESSLYRTPDGALHVVYPKTVGTAGGQLGHTSIDPDGSVVVQNDVLGSPWATIDSSPVIVGIAGGGLRVVAGGLMDTTDGYWSQGRMSTMTAGQTGESWSLAAVAIGGSTDAYGSYGTAATSLADGTPVAAFPLNSQIRWHVGLGEDPDQEFSVASCCAYDMNMVRDGDDVWMSWYANGDTAATNGLFVRQILPVLGPIMKAPQSSDGHDSLPTGRTALVARTGGGVYAAYCTGYPYCTSIGLWKVGTSTVVKVPATKYADDIAVSAGPSGRLWLAWSDNIPTVHAVRTNAAATKIGSIQAVGRPPKKDSVYSLAIDGTTGRGDVVINVGDAFWHTQVAPGLSVGANPSTFKHGSKKKVTFTVTDAGDALSGVKVKVGSKSCTTSGSGRCAITFPKSTKAGSLVAKATKAGYAVGSKRIKVS